MSEYDYYEELKKFCRSREIWNEEEDRPTRFVINTLKTVEKTQVPDGFTIKPIKFALCQSCLKELKGKQKQYCSGTCKQNLVELKKKFTELNKDDKDLTWIVWTKNPDGKPEWKDVKGIANVNGMYFSEHNIITKKSGKTRNKDY